MSYNGLFIYTQLQSIVVTSLHYKQLNGTNGYRAITPIVMQDGVLVCTCVEFIPHSVLGRDSESTERKVQELLKLEIM